jgi:DNA-binding LacI/PurR family transcriptional regulator
LEHASKQRLSDPFFLEMLGGIADELTARNYSMLLSKTTQDPREWVINMVGSRRVDGVIVIGQSLHHAHLNELAAADINMVVWGAQLADQRYATVGSDNREAGYVGASHLIGQGCQRIVFLGDTAVPEVSARRDGYIEALRHSGLERIPRLEVAVRFGSDSAYEAVSSLLNAHAEFDGIFACSDVIAMSAMRALSERGRRIPADVSVVGFDDVPLAAYTTPPLTTLRQDWAAGARSLVDQVLRPRSGKAPGATVLPTELIVRASSLREHHRHARSESSHKRRRVGGAGRAGLRSDRGSG